MTRKKLLTVEELAQLLGKPISWVYNNIQKEEIPHIKLGQQYRFVEEDIDRWIRDRSKEFVYA